MAEDDTVKNATASHRWAEPRTPTSTRTDDLRAADAVPILYTNWRGDTAVRQVRPAGSGTGLTTCRFAATEYHPERQWLIAAVDVEKGAWRDFALAGIKAWGKEAVEAALASTPSPPAGTGDVEGLRNTLEHLANCADPFGQCVFDDNGDVTVSSNTLTTGDWSRLRRAARRAREALLSQVLHPTAPGGSTGDRDASPAAVADGDISAEIARRAKDHQDATEALAPLVKNLGYDRSTAELFATQIKPVLQAIYERYNAATTPPTPEGLDREAVVSKAFRAIRDWQSQTPGLREPKLRAIITQVINDALALRPTPTGDGDVVEALRMSRLAVLQRVESYRPWVEKIPGRVNPWQSTLDAVDAALAASKAQGGTETAAARDVLAERRRQVNTEGWTSKHDDTHDNGEMAIAAACYATAPPATYTEREWQFADKPKAWPWHPSWWKPRLYRRNLVKAGALILAEIERLDRAAPQPATNVGAKQD